MKIQIKHRYNGSILFEHESENNTIKETLIQAINANSNLRGCDLSGCDLSNSDFRGTILRGCDLSGCDLSGSDLSGSDLRGSDLRGCAIPIFSKWEVSTINNEIIKIGCKQKTIEDWDLFFASEEEFDTKRGTAEFKQIEAMYLAHKAYLTHLNS